MNHSIALLALCALSACESVPKGQNPSSQRPGPEGGEARVWIARPDGSKSCEPNSGRDLKTDEAPLKDAGIPVFDAKKGDDGMMHAQVCGADTGRQNRYLIPADRLADALKLGFEAVQD